MLFFAQKLKVLLVPAFVCTVVFFCSAFFSCAQGGDLNTDENPNRPLFSKERVGSFLNSNLIGEAINSSSLEATDDHQETWLSSLREKTSFQGGCSQLAPLKLCFFNSSDSHIEVKPGRGALSITFRASF